MEPGYALDPMNAIDDAEPFEQAPDVQAVLDEQPSRPTRAVTTSRYKPGTRQVSPVTETAPLEGSWWTRPDADFEANAQRMRAAKRMKVPGEDNIIGMNSHVFR